MTNESALQRGMILKNAKDLRSGADHGWGSLHAFIQRPASGQTFTDYSWKVIIPHLETQFANSQRHNLIWDG